MLDIQQFITGSVQTNTYLVSDTQAKEAIIIDPGDYEPGIFLALQNSQRKLIACWLTHAHFDHIGGIIPLRKQVTTPFPCYLHTADLPLWHSGGSASYFNFQVQIPSEPDELLADAADLSVGAYHFKVIHAPGHTPGHVVYYCAAENLLFSGDVLFKGSIGRTDFPGGNYQNLMESIHTHILSLPDKTRVLSGHGSETTVGIERRSNPFLINPSPYLT